MSRQLRHSTTSTEEGTATVLTSCQSRLFWNRIRRPCGHARFAQTPKGPNTKQDRSDHFEDRNVGGNGAHFVGDFGDLQGGGVDNVANEERDDNFEGVLGGDQRAGFAEPREGHAFHHLGHEDVGAHNGAPERRMQESGIAATEEAVLPFTCGDFQVLPSFEWDGGEEHLAFANAAFGLLVRVGWLRAI